MGLYMDVCECVCICLCICARLFALALRERMNMKYGGKEEDLGGVGGGEKNMNKLYCMKKF